MGAITGSLHHLQRTAKLDPSDHRPLRLLGLIYKDFERYEDAVPEYEEALRLDPNQPGWDELRQELATCQIKLRRFRDALATLGPCSQSASVLVMQAECLHALDDSEKGQGDSAKGAGRGSRET
jgi:Flp pilus assembly protein TadD